MCSACLSHAASQWPSELLVELQRGPARASLRPPRMLGVCEWPGWEVSWPAETEPFLEIINVAQYSGDFKGRPECAIDLDKMSLCEEWCVYSVCKGHPLRFFVFD